MCSSDLAPKNGMKAAVVGAGPAGLTIAVLLARWGYDITIFDARDKIGGVMRYGIPNYRLPDSVLDDFQYRHLELKGIHRGCRRRRGCREGCPHRGSAARQQPDRPCDL